MSVVRRSIRNVIRSPLRTGLIVAILAVSVGLALIMLTVHGAAATQLASIGAEIGTEIEVRPAGLFGMMGGGEPLDGTAVEQIQSISHVVAVQRSVQIRYTSDSLEPAVGTGRLGGIFGGGDGLEGRFSRMAAITITGVDSMDHLSQLIGGGQIQMVEGRALGSEDSSGDVVVVGQTLAERNGLVVGSGVDINGASMEVIGIFTSGQRFGDNMLLMPITTVQGLFDLEGVTSATVVVDHVGNIDGVVAAIRGIFPEDVADIVTTSGMYERINQPLVNASSTSQIGMMAAFVVAAVVILFSVLLMVRQRVREIGIQKAIGASNWRIGLQFGVETLSVSVLAAIVGALMTFPLAQRVADLLVVGSDASPAFVAEGFMREGIAGEGFRGFMTGGITRFAGIDVAVSSEVFLYALGIAIALALVASVFPAWYIARVKPAEVLRYE